MEIVIKSAIITFCIMASVTSIICYFNNSKKKNCFHAEVNELLGKPEFNGDLRPVTIKQIETGISFFYELHDVNNLVIRHFDADWDREHMNLWCKKNGYLIAN